MIRSATPADLDAIRHIYNEGIADRLATLDEHPKTNADIADWWSAHAGRYAVLVAQDTAGNVVGWASLNAYSQRRAYRGVAELSIYIKREMRSAGIGTALLTELERRAVANDFHKIVLFTFLENLGGRRLYDKLAYREVGIFKDHGRIDGCFVDIMAMEKILPRSCCKPPAL